MSENRNDRRSVRLRQHFQKLTSGTHVPFPALKLQTILMDLAGWVGWGWGAIMRGARGFSLVELLIVVAIILLIAAIAVPSFLRSRIVANESAAVGALRTLNTAQISYESAYSAVGYATTLGALAGTSCAPPSSSGACLIDTTLAGGVRNGYSFSLGGTSGSPNATYQVIAVPTLYNYSGIRYFCSFQDAVVRASVTLLSTCDASVPPQD